MFPLASISGGQNLTMQVGAGGGGGGGGATAGQPFGLLLAITKAA